MPAFLLGILLVQQQSELPSLSLAWFLLPAAMFAIRWPRFGLPLIFFIAGVLWVSFRAGLVLDQSLASEIEGQDLVVTGRIADLPAPAERGKRFRFDVEQAVFDGRTVRVPKRVQLSRAGELPTLAVGDQWQFTVRLRRPHGYRNPGSFDREAYLFQQRVQATGYVREKEPQLRLSGMSDDLREGVYPTYRLDRFRQQLSARLQALLPGEPFAAMVTAFANGDDDSIPDGQWEVLNRTGTSHLIAISGMNIGLVAGIVFLWLRWLWSRLGRSVLWIPAPRVAAVGAMLAALGYAALAGFAIPTVRAVIMLSVVMTGLFFGVQFAPSVLLALALMLVLVIDPLSVMAAGFWLSFAAVAVILYVAMESSRESLIARMTTWGRVQLAITLTLFPVLLFMFQQSSLAGPLANLIAIPVVEIVVIPATLLGAAFSFLFPPELAAWPLKLASGALALLWLALVWLSELPGVIWEQHSPPLWAMAAAVIGALMLFAPRSFPARWLGIVWLLPVFLVRPSGPATGEAWLTLLDVGQGLSVVVRTATHAMVFDTGPRLGSRFDTGRAVVVPYLRQAGVRQLDLLMLSHGDNDHIGGAASILKDYPVSRVLASVPEWLPNTESCVAGQGWEWDGVRFMILNPEAESTLKGNNRSCVLRVATVHGRALLPADIARPAERRLVRDRAALLSAEVLIAPHHGSKSSSSIAFLEAVRPRLVLFPVGYRNRFHHPHQDVVDRYREQGVKMTDSASGGAIEIRFANGEYQVSNYRQAQLRYWHVR